MRPSPTTDNTTGYIADSLTMTVDAGGMPSYIVAAADDCYTDNKTGYIEDSLIMTVDDGGKPSYIVAAADDI